MRRSHSLLPFATAAALCACVALSASEVKSFPGVGRAVAEKSMFGQEKENQKALDRAQALAVQDAMKDALAELLGATYLEPERLNSLRRDLADHSGEFVRDTVVKDSAMDGLNAKTQILLKIDMASLKAYVKRQGLSLTAGLASKFKFFVLSYTVEGMDANLNKPIVLHEEVKTDSSSSASSNFSNSTSASTSLKGSRDDGAVLVAGDRGAAFHASANIDANSQEATANAGGQATAQAASFYRVVDYADPTKKGMAATNEVRALLEGQLHRADLKVATIVSPLVGLEFKAEDEFVNKVLDSVRRHEEAQEDDCVVIALNALTPIEVPRGYQFTSKVTLHAVTVKDGTNLLESNSVTKTSAVQASADAARTQAIKLCMGAMADRLPEQVRRMLQDLQAVEAGAVAAPAGVYTIVVTKVPEQRQPLVNLKKLLKQGGFTNLHSETKAGGTMENIVVTLGDKSAEDLKDILDDLPPGLAMVSKSDTGAKLSFK